MLKRFSSNEIEFIIQNHGTKSYKEIAKILKRTEKSVYHKCCRLGLLQIQAISIGQRFNKLVAVYEIKLENKKVTGRKFLCNCDCGKINIPVRRSSLISGKAKSCGCLQKERASELAKEKRLKDGVSTFKAIENTYKQGAKSRGKEYQLEYELFLSLIISNCYYCNSKPKPYNKHLNNNGTLNNWAIKNGTDLEWAMRQWIVKNGIDRKNNEKGYVKDNVVACCETCNRAKQAMGYEDFIRWITSIDTKNIVRD